MSEPDVAAAIRSYLAQHFDKYRDDIWAHAVLGGAIRWNWDAAKQEMVPEKISPDDWFLVPPEREAGS